MMGSHELLLIVRAQNQASAALGRVSRDLRRMAAQRDLELRRSAIINRLARNAIQQSREQARIDSVLKDNGAARLAHNQALARNAFQQASIQDRIANLEIRRTGISRTLANLEMQRMRVVSQELRIEQGLEKIELRRQAINAQIGRMGTQLLRNGVQEQALNRQAYGLQTQLLERQLRYNKARRSLAAAEKGDAGATRVNDLRTMATIARRRVQETKMAQAGIPGQRGVLASAGGDIRNQIAGAQGNLRALRNEELQLAQASEILTQKQKALRFQLRNVQARSAAVDGAERQLRSELKIVSDQVGVLNGRWEQHVAVTKQAAASLGILQAEEAQLNAQLAEQTALIAGQNRQAWSDRSRAAGHFGRVMQMTGLITTAAFAAMAIGAANFNKEATRAATQTGPIGSGTQLIVKNAERAQKAIIALMHQVPADQNQLTDSLYNIYSSMNTTFGQGTKLLKLFAQVWVAGGMLGDVNEVADALITLGNNWNISAGDMAGWQKLAASTLATVRFGRLTVEQYTQTMNQLAPAFHGAHQSIEQMNGAIAFMTRLLPSQRMSAAGLARFMEIIGRFAAKPAHGFEQLAKDIQDAQGNLLPLDQIMKIFIERFPKLRTSSTFLNNFIKLISNQQGTVQARRALQGLVQQNALYNQTLANTTSDQKEFNRSLKAMEQSTGVKWAQFINDMKALALEIGTAALPALIKLGSIVQKLAKWYDGLSNSQKDAIAKGGAFAAMGTLLFGTALAVAGSLAAMVLSLRILGGGAGFAKITGLMGGNAAVSKTLASESGNLSVKMGLVGGALALLLPLLFRHPQAVGQAVDAYGGFNTILQSTGYLVSAFTVKKLVDGFAATRTGAFLATGEALALRTALFRLSILGAITIPIILHYSQKFDKDPRSKSNNKVENWWLDAVGGVPLVGGGLKAVAKAGGEMGRQTMDQLGLSDKARADAKKKSEAKFMNKYVDMAGGIRAMQTVNNSPHISDLLKSSAAAAFAAGDYKSVAKIAKMATISIPSKISGSAQLPQKANRAAGIRGDAWLVKQVKIVGNLQRIWEKAPNPTNWRNFHKAMDGASRAMTKNQKKMFDDLLGAYMSDIKDATKADDKLAKRRIENAKNAATQIQNITQSIQQMYETSLSQNQQQMGDLFSGRFITKSATVLDRQQFGFGLRPSDLMKDLKMQVGDFQRFNSTITKLGKRGAPQEMIEQLQQMGPEAQKQIGLLLRLSPAQFKKYVAMFQQGQKDVQKATERDVNAQLTKWNKFGRKVQMAIITGVKSQNPELEDAITSTVLRMFPGLSKQAGKQRPKSTVHNETHNYNIHPSADGSGVRTQIKSAHFAYKTRKRPGP